MEQDDFDFDAVEDVDDQLHARASDPDTSHEAMAAVDRGAMLAASRLIQTLLREDGEMADYQMRDRFSVRWGRPSSRHLYQQARSVARDHGWVRDTGRRVVNPESNRKQIVWEACDQPPVVITKCSSCGHVLRRQQGDE